MRTTKCVLGVSGVCWVDSGYSTQSEALFFKGCRAVCWVCWVFRRARACMTLVAPAKAIRFFFHARTDKPSKPNTPNTMSFRCLNLKGFICVGFVLGMGFFVLGMVCGGIWG